ncbi:MAG TPA: YdcF family protein [Burkholderiaceae bacterium]
MRNLKRIIFFGLGIIMIAVGLIVGAGLNDHIAKADLIVVPGNTIASDGTPSPRLKARLDTALQLFRDGYAQLIFVSGGVGKEGFDEAVSMSNYLQKNGIPQKSIIIDSLGTDTAATAKNAADYLRTNNLKSALVATQYFHVPRTKLALERNGVKVVGASHARYFEMRDIYSTLRETVAYAAYYAKS